MLTNLPPEIFIQIVVHLSTAKSIVSLGLTCRILHTLVEEEGWKTFVLTQFPSFQSPPIWRQAAHALTTLSRNIERKAFLARDLEPFRTRIYLIPQRINEVVKGKWRRPHGQTMGYQPVIDSCEIWTGSDWESRKEVVAWGAGAKLMMKTTRRGREIDNAWRKANDDERELEYDHGRSKIDWLSYDNEQTHVEGRDDITTLKFIKPQQSFAEEASTREDLVVGRASGGLSLLRFKKAKGLPEVCHFETTGLPVRAADISQGHSPLLAACLGNARVALYDLCGSDKSGTPINEVNTASKTEPRCRTWSSHFLSPHKLVIGKGASEKIALVYEVHPTGLSEMPLRGFRKANEQGQSHTSAYSITGIPESTVSSQTTGNVFLTGAYDGIIRFHDMRSPSDCEMSIHDPTDYSAIFSILMIGREHIVAGGATNALLKMFDVRMPGGRVYNYLDTLAVDGTQGPTQMPGISSGERAWNIFTAPNFTGKDWQARQKTSPIYALSRPSSSSTSLYVGRENSVTHFNFTSVLDEQPDPVFDKYVRRWSNGRIDVQKTWDPPTSNRVLQLSMYDQTISGNVPLKVQREVGYMERAHGYIPGYDERWMSVGR